LCHWNTMVCQVELQVASKCCDQFVHVCTLPTETFAIFTYTTTMFVAYSCNVQKEPRTQWQLINKLFLGVQRWWWHLLICVKMPPRELYRIFEFSCWILEFTCLNSQWRDHRFKRECANYLDVSVGMFDLSAVWWHNALNHIECVSTTRDASASAFACACTGTPNIVPQTPAHWTLWSRTVQICRSLQVIWVIRMCISCLTCLTCLDRVTSIDLTAQWCPPFLWSQFADCAGKAKVAKVLSSQCPRKTCWKSRGLDDFACGPWC
jgi:hypothetical protein